MNLPRNAEDAHASLAEAYNTKDLATVLSMYDTSGLFFPEPGKVVTGEDAWTSSVKEILAIPGRMEVKTVYCYVTGDIAFGRSEWNITDGEEVRIAARGIEVMKRQADGTWKILIDHPFGAASDLRA